MAITTTPLLGLPYAGADTDETYDVLARLFVKDGQMLTLPEIVERYTPTTGTVYIKAADWTAADGTADAYDAKITISGVEPDSMILIYPSTETDAEKAKRLGIRAKASPGVASDDTFVIVRATGGDPTVTDKIEFLYIALRGFSIFNAGITPPGLTPPGFPTATVIGVDPYIATEEGDRDDISASQRLVTKAVTALRSTLSTLTTGLADTNKAVELRLKSADLPTKLDEYRAAKGLIDKTVSDLVNYYTKSQTLTKDEINALVSAIPKFKIEVVTSLPTSNISDTTVYLVKSGDDDTNLYTEYIRTGGKWEKLGTQTVDLTGYVTEQMLNQRLYDYMTLRDVEVLLGSELKYYYTKNEIDHQFIKLRDLPDSFPNPNPITINGVSYDGSEPVVLRLDELPIVESVEEMGDPENNDKYYVLQETGQIWRARYVKGSDNWLPKAYTSATDHSPYNGKGYATGKRIIGTTGEEKDQSNCLITGYIPINPGDIVRFRRLEMDEATYGCIAPVYDENGAILSNAHAGFGQAGTAGQILREDNGDYIWEIPTTSAVTTVRFARLQCTTKSGTPDPSTGIITVNEEISEVETGWHWVDTGVKYTWGNDTALLDLEQRVTDAETEIEALKKYTEFPDEVPDYWREHLSEKIKEIQTAQKNAKQRCVTWAAVSDLHESSAVNTTGVIIKAVCDACDINVVLGLGDFSTRASKASEAEAVNTIGYAYNNLSPILDRLLPVRGNHDGGWDTGDRTLLKPSVVDGIISYPMHTGLEITYDAVGSGYYVTDKARKVRYIMLNTNHRGADPDATVSADGSSAYPYMSFYRITQTQMEMIRDALTTIPNDSWSVVIASHIPPIGQIDRYGDGSYVIDISAHFGDYVALRDLINAYVDREAKTITYAGTATWDQINLSVDFSEAKGHLVEYESGHLHKYLYFNPLDVDPKTETVIGFPLRTVRCDGFQENHDDTNDSALDDAYAAQRVKGTTSEHSFLVCVHNIDSRLTTCIHIGVQEA